MVLTGKLTDVSKEFLSNKLKLTFTINEKVNSLEEIENVDKLSMDVKKFRNKRSLNSNNYAWELITRIGNVLNKSKEEIYFEMLKNYGQSQMISVLEDIDVGKFLKYYEEAGKSELNGKLFKHYKVYTGSSEFSTRRNVYFY